jgi:predicted  nucleic acid-binding Zn-ribbon protein
MQLTIGQMAETLAETIRGLTKNTIATVERRIAVVEGEAARFAAIDATVLVADMARIEAIDTDQLAADHAKIGSIDTNQLTADHAVIENLDSNYAHITNGKIDNVTIGHADIDGLAANYAQADLANVNNAWIENGVVKNNAIGNAQIISVSANKLTTGTIDASDIRVINLSADNITAGTINGQRFATGSIDLAKLTESVYTEQEVDDMLAAMDARIDSQIQTWSGDAVPTLNNYPASDWNTDALREQHVGDVYYVANAGSQADGYSYRFVWDKTSAQYRWALIQDSAITDALQRLLDAVGDIDGLQSFQGSTSRWMSAKDDEVSSLIASKSEIETALGDKVSSSTFNEVKQTVTENSATITSLSTTVSNGFTTINNTVNTVKQTADANKASITSLTQTVSDNEADIEQKYSTLDQTVDGLTSTVGAISESISDGERRLTAAESAIKQTADGIELCATKTEVQSAAAYAAGLYYDHTYVKNGTQYTFTANVRKGAVDVTDQFIPDMFVWYLRNETGDELFHRGLSVTVDEELAGYHGTLVGGLEETWDGVLCDHNGDYIVTENNVMISTYSEWEVSIDG